MKYMLFLIFSLFAPKIQDLGESHRIIKEESKNVFLCYIVVFENQKPGSRF